MNKNYTVGYVIRNENRRFLKSVGPDRWGTIGESQIFDNHASASRVASKIPGAGVRHILVKTRKR